MPCGATKLVHSLRSRSRQARQRAFEVIAFPKASPSEIERKSCIRKCNSAHQRPKEKSRTWKCNSLLFPDGPREKPHNSGAGETQKSHLTTKTRTNFGLCATSCFSGEMTPLGFARARVMQLFPKTVKAQQKVAFPNATFSFDL